MPFCSQCGTQVGQQDAYCARCGASQATAAKVPPPPKPGADPLASLNPRTASILCYIPGIGWIISIVVLAADKFRRDYTVRFHAFQGLYLFVAWLMDDWVLRPLLQHSGAIAAHRIIQAVLLGMSIFMMVKASHGENYQLPVIGELAQRSVNED
jgi:uncharacterized membrane protein